MDEYEIITLNRTKLRIIGMVRGMTITQVIEALPNIWNEIEPGLNLPEMIDREYDLIDLGEIE